MTSQVIVCALCGTPEDNNEPTQPCARCDCPHTKLVECSCHVTAFIEPGFKVFIGYRYITLNPDCFVHR